MLIFGSLVLSGCLATTGAVQADGATDVASAAPAKATLDPEYRSLLLAHGKRALEGGKLEEAVSAYKRILDAAPDDPEATYGLAEAMLASGNNAGALGHYRTIGTNSDFRARSLQGEGIVLLNLGQHQQSREILEQAVKADATLWRAWNALGRTLDVRGEHDKARESYDRALALAPDSAVVHNNRGISFMLAGRFGEAESDLKKAVGLDRELERARSNLRLALAWQGKYAEALADVSRVDAPVALNNIGYIAMKRGDLGHAEAYFAQAKQLSPAFYDKADRNLQFLREMKSFRKSAEAVKG